MGTHLGLHHSRGHHYGLYLHGSLAQHQLLLPHPFHLRCWRLLVAEARDITRIYGKIRKKRYDVLDLEEDDEDFDIEDYLFDDDDE